LEKVSETCTPAKREAKRPSHSAKIDCLHMDVERRKVKVRVDYVRVDYAVLLAASRSKRASALSPTMKR